MLSRTLVVKIDTYFVDRYDERNYKKIGELALKRRERATLFGKKCWVASKEDFILSKLVFGGWQDYADALGCWIRFKDQLDKTYLDDTSKELEIQKEMTLLQSGVEDPDEFFNKLRS